MKDFLLPYLEWEVLVEPVTITEVDDRPELPKGKKEIKIERDEDYNLKARLHFEDSIFEEGLRPSSGVAGSFAEGFDIQGSHFDIIHYSLKSCTLGSVHESSRDQHVSGTVDLHFKELKIEYQNENEGTHLVEWYLNGPDDSVFCRTTNRKLARRFNRVRSASKEDKIDSIEISGLDSSSVVVDFLRVKIPDLEFLVTKVPNGIGPDFSSNIGIEYRKTWGRIPDVYEREKIEELCSFIFGRQLLSVGYTLFDQNENLVEAHVHDPWGKRAKSYCIRPDEPPIRIGSFTRSKAEGIISQLLPTYYEKRESLLLKESLWHYWTSRDTPVGGNLPMLAAALETIMNGWYKSIGSRSRGVYMKNREFNSLLKEEITAIQRKLTDKENGDKITANIMNAYNFGIMEQYRVFFDEIELPTSDYEREAINERHKFVHGRIIFDETDWKRVIQLGNTLETLLHKVLLKLLGYSGEYIDRSVLGWSDKRLG